jgi:polyribonucleotide nucleotidyltransferase
MGSVCGSTLSLMDAGVPIRAPVAGVAMGLVTGEGGRHAVLTDIQGLEDHIGDMDFKVAGTADGITALQLDIKVQGVSLPVLAEALDQAREARMHILGKIREAIAEPRTVLSPYAPRIVRVQIPVEKIGALIGPGGKTVRAITQETGASIDVEDDGTVYISSSDDAALRKARERIEGLTREIEVGTIYTGKVTRLTSFGAFVEIAPGKDGLVRLPDLAEEPVERVEDAVAVGDEVTVMVIEIDRMGRVNLSRRAVLQGREGAAVPRGRGRPPPRPPAPPYAPGPPGAGPRREMRAAPRGREYPRGPRPPAPPRGPDGRPEAPRRPEPPRQSETPKSPEAPRSPEAPPPATRSGLGGWLRRGRP